MEKIFKDQRIAITGACGTIGSELVRQLLEDVGVQGLVCLDNNESALFFLSNAFLNIGKLIFSR